MYMRYYFVTLFIVINNVKKYITFNNVYLSSTINNVKTLFTSMVLNKQRLNFRDNNNIR